MDLKSKVVRFKVRDVYFPDAAEVLGELHGDEILEGRVVDLTDGGTVRDKYVVVQVEGLRRLPIVAVQHLLSVS